MKAAGVEADEGAGCAAAEIGGKEEGEEMVGVGVAGAGAISRWSVLVYEEGAMRGMDADGEEEAAMEVEGGDRGGHGRGEGG